MSLAVVFFCCALLGSVTGLLSGLLGIGGGLIIVPVLAKLLPALGVNDEIVMPMSLATSLATIVLTSLSAARAHHKNANIPWQMAPTLMVAIAVGALSGSFVADALSSQMLESIFSVFVILLAGYMVLSIKLERSSPTPSNAKLGIMTFSVGNIASMMGIGGGAILIPMLNYYSVNMRLAIGLASACSVAVAFAGCLGYVVAGLDEPHLPQWSLGFVYLPALLGIILTSTQFAPLGVKLASRLPVPTIKKFFAIFLIFVALEMLFT